MSLFLLMCTWVLATAAASSTDTAAVVGGRKITRKAVEERVYSALIQHEQKRYEILRAGLLELVGEQLISLAAQEQGVSAEEFVAAEVDAKTPQPEASQIDEVYEANEKKFGNTPVDQARKEVADHLYQQAKAKRHRALLTYLKGQFPTRLNMFPPSVQIDTGGRPSLGGGASAPVTLIEFSDYECVYCKRAEPVIKEILETYGDQVRFVYRDFPLAMHKNARPASHAARCAEAQGQFWPYHEKLMASEDLDETVYKAIADEVGLDQDAFDACLESETVADLIDRDVADGKAVGVSSTPAFFVNGRLIKGAKPLAVFKEMIDAELAGDSGS